MVQCEFDVSLGQPTVVFDISIGQPGRGFGQIIFDVEIASDPTFGVSIASSVAFDISLAQPTDAFDISLAQPNAAFAVEVSGNNRFLVTAFGSGGGDLTAEEKQKLNSIWSGATRDLNPAVVPLCNFNIVTTGTQFTVEPADGIKLLARGRIPRNAFTAGGIIRYFVTGSITFSTTGTVTAYFSHNDSSGASSAPIGVSHSISGGNFQLEAELTNNVLVFGTNGVQQLFAKYRAPDAFAVPTESIAQAQSFFNFLHFPGRFDAGSSTPYEVSDIGVSLSLSGAGGVFTCQMVYAEIHGMTSNRYTLSAPSQQGAPKVVN